MSSGIADTGARALGGAALLVCSLLAGCGRDPIARNEGPPAKPRNFNVVEEGELLRPDAGVVMTDRSAEHAFVYAALNVVDGANATYWAAPPEDPEQWAVIDLPARSRVTGVGASTNEEGGGLRPPGRLRFEGSLDGATFTELGTVDLVPARDRQILDIAPREIRTLRITMLPTPDGPTTPNLATVHLRGEELEPPAPPAFAGHWSIDGRPLEIRQEGNALYAIADMEPPMIFYGAVEGRVARLAWSRGNETGVAWLAVNRAGTHLSGNWWWLDPLMNPDFGETWYGERKGDPAPFGVEVPSIAQVHLKKLGRFPLYGLVFGPDGELDVDASRSGVEFIRRALGSFPTYRVRLEVLDSGSWDSKANLASASIRANKLRAALERAGIPASRLVVEPRQRTDLNSPLHRLLYTRVDFSLAGN